MRPALVLLVSLLAVWASGVAEGQNQTLDI